MNTLLTIIFTTSGVITKDLELFKIGGLFAIASSINVLTLKILEK